MCYGSSVRLDSFAKLIFIILNGFKQNLLGNLAALKLFYNHLLFLQFFVIFKKLFNSEIK
jgi:hypothetical protein